MNKYHLAFLLLAVLGPPCSVQAGPGMLGCLIEPRNVADLGSPVVSVVEKLMADRGDFVKQGQVLAVLRSDVERANVEVARSRSQARSELQAASANHDFAEQKYRRSKALLARNFISQNTLDELANELKIAKQKVDQTRQQLEILEGEYSVAQAQLGLRSLRSPFDGVITERYLSQGERMEEKPIFRVAQLDPLRVEVILPAARFGEIKIGDEARVSPELPSFGPVMAQVTLVDRVIDAASNTFRVRLHLPNPDQALPAGVRCKIEFGMNQASSIPPTAPKVASPSMSHIPPTVSETPR